MNLSKKKKLAVRTLNVGEKRIVFVTSRLDEIKEAITKQDIRDLQKSGAIKVRNVKGRKTVIKVKKRSQGNVRKKINDRKRKYMINVRKQRKYISFLKSQGKISKEEYYELRKKIRNKHFSSLNQLKQFLKIK